MLSIGVVVATDGSEDSSAVVALTYAYDYEEKTAIVNTGSGSGDLTIPHTVMYAGDEYRVTEIRNNAFDGLSGITSVDLGSVEFVGQWAFRGCTGITSLTLPASVKELANQAFIGCTGITSLDLGSIEKTGNEAFSGCTGLISVTLPSTLTFIRQNMFNGCINLVSADLSALQYPMTQFENSMFFGCTRLTSVTLSNETTEIPSMMFSNCSNLASLTIPASVTSIGSNAFMGCTGLNALAVPVGISIPVGGAYSGMVVRYTGAVEATAHFNGGSSITVTTPDRMAAVSLIDSMGGNVSYSGSIDSWTFTYPSAASYVTMTLDALDLKIYTVADLKKIGVDPVWTTDKSYVLMNSISFTGADNPFAPIGTPNDPFTGKFDGNGYIISNVSIVMTSSRAAGFFGNVGGNAEISNLTLSGGTVVAGVGAAGGIVGVITPRSAVSISNCHNGNSVSGGYASGGIVGFTYEGTMIDGCTNTGGISATLSAGYAYAGGIVGYVNGTSASKVMISDSANNAGVGATAPHSRSGGIAGFARHMVATDCTNTGGIQGGYTFDTGSTIYVGGMVGRLESSSLTGCINEGIGSVGISTLSYTGPNHSFGYWLGGIAGDMVYGSTILNCINYGMVSGRPPGGTSQMHLGGIVGCMYQGTSVTYSTNYRAVQSNQDSVAGLYTYAGGIAGAAVGTDTLGASITGCTAEASSPYRADVAITGTNVRAGGILGYGSYATVSGCEAVGNISGNGGSIYFGISGASVRAGGIAGYLENSTLFNCNSSGSVTAQTFNSNGVSEAGGIVGRMSGLASYLSGCINLGNVSSSNIAGYAYAGGVAGALVGGAITADDCVNMAPVSVSSPNARAGGIAGLVRGVTMTGSTNSGAVTATNTFAQGSTIYLGGIAGRLENSSLSRCGNGEDASVTVATATNPGSNGSFRYWLGGIAGDMTYEASLFECHNMADVSATVPKGTTYVYMGGLVGCMYQGTSAVDCSSSGDVSGGNGSVPGLFAYVGGAVGAATGTSSMGVEITNCDSSTSSPARVDVTVTAANARAGGILGYGLYATVSNCDFVGAVVGAGGSVTDSISGASVRSGGIAGYLEHSGLAACTAAGSVSAMTISNDGLPRAGGIVGSMVMDTTVSNCVASGSVIANSGIITSGKAYAGGIAGLTEGTITGCMYGATTSLGAVTSVGFESGAGGLAGMVGAGRVLGVAHANVVSEYAGTFGGNGRAGAGAGFVKSSASVSFAGSTGTREAYSPTV